MPPTPKDDLESLAYILISFAKKGELFKKSENKSKEERKKYLLESKQQ